MTQVHDKTKNGKFCYINEIFVTGGIESCQNDNFQYSGENFVKMMTFPSHCSRITVIARHRDPDNPLKVNDTN